MKRQSARGERKRTPVPQRGRNVRPIKTRILIVCEGRVTEPNYFRGLSGQETIRRQFVVDVRKGKGGSPLGAVQLAIDETRREAQREEAYDEVWCVLDVEHAQRNPYLPKAQALAANHSIHLALSNPAFEVWLLAHLSEPPRLSWTRSKPTFN